MFRFEDCKFMRMDKPEISVIIPVHNSQEHLQECLDSLQQQSFTDFEVLVINNGSTDNSYDIAKQISDQDDRFVVINHNHGRQGEARNVGLNHANGKYISFVDSDDTVLEHYLARLHTAITRHDADVAVCGYCLYYRKSDKVIQTHKVKNSVYNRTDAMKELLRDRKMRFYLWNKLWKSSLFKDHHIDIPDMFYEDAVACSMLFCHVDKVVMTDYCGYSYIRASNKIFTEIEMDKTRINDYINTVPMIRDYLEAKGLYQTVKTPFLRHICHVFLTVPILSAQAGSNLERGLLKNSVAGMGKVLRACKAHPDELNSITREPGVI